MGGSFIRLAVRIVILAIALLNRAFRRPVRPTNPRRILIAHYLLLGDTILLAPLMKKISQIYPESERVILCREGFTELFAGYPYGFTALAINRRNPNSLLNILSSGPYDLVFVLGDNRYAWLAKASGAAWIIGYSTNKASWKNLMLNEQHSLDDGDGTWADRISRLVDGQSVAAYKKNEWILQESKSDISDRVIDTKYALLHLGASTPLKHWPQEYWRALVGSLSKLGLKSVVSVGPGEEWLLSEFVDDEATILSPGQLSLGQLAYLMRRAALIVSTDTGVAHLGKIIDTPVITIFGPGSPVVHGAGYFWGAAKIDVVWAQDYRCRDQNILFNRTITWAKRCGRTVGQCPTPGACMRAVEPDSVLIAAQKLLGFKSNASPN